jgi:pimeloyl-ACP methyl ester carboxylesterase
MVTRPRSLIVCVRSHDPDEDAITLCSRAVPLRAASLAVLLRWLGPWTSSARVPEGIERERWSLRDDLSTYLYRPRGPAVGTYLIAPGLHFLGPDDPRLDRFCRVLARAGFRVVAPFLPSFIDLVVRPSAPDDFEIVARASVERFGAPVAVFSISFGSWPALEVAARLGRDVDGVITFGGYAELEAAIRFAVDGVMRTPGGDVTLARDPLNSPALFLNVLPHLEAGGDTTELEAAWREMVRTTWGKMELKAPGKLDPFAHALAPRVPAHQRELFLIGCGVVPGAPALIEASLARAGDALAFASPAAALARLKCPVVVCHGRDDDVIPWGEAEKLYAALAPRVPARLLLTGLYGHTGAERPSPRVLAREATTLIALARALAAGGTLREHVTAQRAGT